MLRLVVAIERIGVAVLMMGTEVPRTGTARSGFNDVGRKHAKAESDRRSTMNITVEMCCQYQEVRESRLKETVTKSVEALTIVEGNRRE